VTELDPVETEVRTVLPCLMSIIVPLDGPSVAPVLVVATALVNATVPKLANGTSEPPSSKSSTIHSAFSRQRALELLIDLVTVCPVDVFLITAVPFLVLLAVTVVVMTSPAEMLMPLKS